jgi:fucose permease
MSYRSVYLALAAVMAAGLIAVLLAPIPAPPVSPGTVRGRRPPRAGGTRVWQIPAALFAIALISVTFFGDGALESFLSTYLQRTLAGGVLLSGLGIASYHFAPLLGRLTATAALRRFGEQRVVRSAGLLAAAGLLITVTVPAAAGAIGRLGTAPDAERLPPGRRRAPPGLLTPFAVNSAAVREHRGTG